MAQNIKVAVRARPLNQREIDLECDVVVSMQDKTTTIQVNKAPKHFTYDFCYNSSESSNCCASQTDVYKEIGGTILANAIDGFNGTLFAYGQTGSGKSHTMMGPPDDYGIIPLMIQDLYERKARIEENASKELQICVSYLEIYKERLTDLFGVEKAGEVKIMEHPKLGVYTPGLTEIACEDREAVMKNLEYGLQRRSIGATNMNQTSSRSHAVFCLRTTALEGARPTRKGAEDERKALTAKINLIDLAGSERAAKTGAEGERLKEGSAINQSLSALGMVIKSLTEKAKGAQVPFRSSKLTFLLKDSLAGNSRTYMIAAISPASDNIDETVSTLRFASSVKSIETVAVQNKDKKDQLIDDLQEEMKALKAALAAGGISSEEAKEQLKERERLKEELERDYGKQLEVAKEMERAREQALNENGLSNHHITQAFGIGSKTPYLVNMAFDPQLAGCLIYLIKEEEPTTMGAHKDNSITLDGIGIPDFLCRIDNLPSAGGVKIRRLSEAGRVGVNGRLLKEQEELHLRNGDQVYLGRSTALKLVCPEEEGHAPPSKADLIMDGDAELAMLEHSPSWTNCEMFVDPVLRQMSKEGGQRFLMDLKRACQLSDEANELTPEYRCDLPMQIEVDLTSSMPPCIVIRVLHCDKGRDCQDEEAWQTKYLWSVNQLEERVDRMKDYARAVKLDSQVELDRMEDPWVETEPVEMVKRLHDLRSAAAEAGQAMQQQLVMSRNGATKDRSMMSIIFWFWKSQVTTEKRKRAPSRAGRPGLVRSKSLKGRMRMTVVPSGDGGLPSPAPRRTSPASPGSPGSPAASTPLASPQRKSVVRSAPRRSATNESNTTDRRSSVGSQQSRTHEAPEATPEVVSADPDASGGASKDGGEAPERAGALGEVDGGTAPLERANERLRQQLYEREAEVKQLRKQAEADARALQVQQRAAEDLRSQLRESRAANEDLQKQLEVAWQLSSVLRDGLLSMKPQSESTAGAEAPPPDVVATADALAATARSVTAAAQAMHEIRAALVAQPPSSAPATPAPGSALVPTLERKLRAVPLTWVSLLPGDRSARSSSPPHLRNARSASPCPAGRLGLRAVRVRPASPTPVRCFCATSQSAGVLVATPPSTPPVSMPGSIVSAVGSSPKLGPGVLKVAPPCQAGGSRSSPSRVRLAYLPSASPSLRLGLPGSGPPTPLSTPPVPGPLTPVALARRPPERQRSQSPRPARAPSQGPSAQHASRAALAEPAATGSSNALGLRAPRAAAAAGLKPAPAAGSAAALPGASAPPVGPRLGQPCGHPKDRLCAGPPAG